MKNAMTFGPSFIPDSYPLGPDPQRDSPEQARWRHYQDSGQQASTEAWHRRQAAEVFDRKYWMGTDHIGDLSRPAVMKRALDEQHDRRLAEEEAEAAAARAAVNRARAQAVAAAAEARLLRRREEHERQKQRRAQERGQKRARKRNK